MIVSFLTITSIKGFYRKQQKYAKFMGVMTLFRSNREDTGVEGSLHPPQLDNKGGLSCDLPVDGRKETWRMAPALTLKQPLGKARHIIDCLGTCRRLYKLSENNILVAC